MDELAALQRDALGWRKITAEGLDVDYVQLMSKKAATKMFHELEKTVVYFTGDLSRVKVFGKWCQIHRQQVSYGDPGIEYRFSGLTVPTVPWTDLLRAIRDKLEDLTGHHFDFVLVNRYKDGSDYIGEHRDNEAELDPTAPIASISLGQMRTFMLRHRDARKPGPDKRNIPPVKIELEHGSLLLMNPPTNKVWYHSLPVRKSAPGVRINMTFRKFKAGYKNK